ncbi:hypothetical protein CHARACLAT_032989 [Characodon lateralis]|uniref:Uncharacterized protein n=1 Tax=Characodon lateralis TaxID=208331 RepID=A0ABU7F8Z1_9TELE|nr:hypothetical protein [Characodon lateralis]
MTTPSDIISTTVNPDPPLAASLGNPVDFSAAVPSEPTDFSETGNKRTSCLIGSPAHCSGSGSYTAYLSSSPSSSSSS